VEGNGAKNGRIQETAAGLYCSVGRDVFRRDGDLGVWQIVLEDRFDGFDLSPLARPAPSPDGRHGAHVAVSGLDRYVCVVSLPGPAVRPLASPLTSVEGMAWSPDGKRLCVIGGDPSVGVLSMDGCTPPDAAPLFSLFVVGKDDADLVPVTGPIVLAGIPRWSPAGDAVAVVGLERGGQQVGLVVTMDGREGPLVSGARVLLGEVAWTATGGLLCAVTDRDGLVRVQRVNTATGEAVELGEPWQDVCWLSLVGERVLVAGKSSGVWVVADVTDGARTMLTAPASAITDVAAAPAHLWVVTQVEGGHLGLWSMDVDGNHLRLHVTAPSVRGMRARIDGVTVAVMAGPTGGETVRVYSVDSDHGADIGRRDVIMGWIEEHLPHGRLPRLHYLLTPAFEAMDVESPADMEADGVTERLELRDVPRPVLPVTMLERADKSAAELSGRTGLGDTSPAVPAEVGLGRRQRIGWIAAIVLLTVAVLVVGAIGAVGVHRLRELGAIADYGPGETTPTTPSTADHTDELIDTPSETVIVPDEPAETPSEPVVEPAETPVELFGVKIGSWTACTELLRVRGGAGVDKPLLGYLQSAQRARVLSGPAVVSSMPWWQVRCYGLDGRPGLTGWVSGVYLRVANAPVVVSAGQTPGDVDTTEKPFTPPMQGVINVISTPSGAGVFVDDIPTGFTPIDLSVSYGTHVIRIEIPDFLPYQAIIEVKKPTSPSEVKTTYIVGALMPLQVPDPAD
jgi:hypothetical protein